MTVLLPLSVAPCSLLSPLSPRARPRYLPMEQVFGMAQVPECHMPQNLSNSSHVPHDPNPTSVKTCLSHCRHFRSFFGIGIYGEKQESPSCWERDVTLRIWKLERAGTSGVWLLPLPHSPCWQQGFPVYFSIQEPSEPSVCSFLQ